MEPTYRVVAGDQATYRYDVLLLEPPLTAAAATQSRLGKLAAMPIYQQLIIRN